MASRPAVLGVARLFVLALCNLPMLSAAPTYISPSIPFFALSEDPDSGKSAADPELWLNLGISAALVLMGGAFAGLTIALMGQVSFDYYYPHELITWQRGDWANARCCVG